MFTNFDVKDILFGQWWQYSRILWIYSRESKFISFRSKLSKSFLSTSLILTKAKTSYQF